MIYHLLEALKNLDIPGQGLFHYLSFRAIISFTAALLISIFAGRRIISWLQKKQIGETIRDLGLEGQMQKKGTPTMGGIIIYISIVIPVLLFAALCLKIVKVEQVKEVGGFLTSILPILFVSPTVGIVEHWGLIRPQLLPIALILVATTALTFGISGMVTQAIMGRKGGASHG